MHAAILVCLGNDLQLLLKGCRSGVGFSVSAPLSGTRLSSAVQGSPSQQLAVFATGKPAAKRWQARRA